MKKIAKFNGARQEEFLEHMREGMRRGAASAAMDFVRRDVLNFIAEHEEFEKAVLDAEGEATEHVEEALYQAAVSGSVTACKFWLELRKPKQRDMLSSMHDPTAPDGSLEDDLEAMIRLTTE